MRVRVCVIVYVLVRGAHVCVRVFTCVFVSVWVYLGVFLTQDYFGQHQTLN